MVWALVACAGCSWLVLNRLQQLHAAFETDARIVHRLLSQRVVQHDAILDTLALLQPGPEAPGAAPPEQRLPALYPHILAVQRRDRDGVRGSHGFDPALPSMRAVFIANGPAFRSGVTLDGFDNAGGVAVGTALSTIATPTATIATTAHLDRATFPPQRARAATVPSVSSRPDISISATAASMQSRIQKVE